MLIVRDEDTVGDDALGRRSDNDIVVGTSSSHCVFALAVESIELDSYADYRCLKVGEKIYRFQAAPPGGKIETD